MLGVLLAADGLCSCAAAPDVAFQDLVQRGEYGRARMHLAAAMSRDRADRDYLLDRMEMGIISLADGVPRYGEPAFEEVYDLLRTQGLNADKTVQSIVLNEDLKFWKGEPFEQAMAYAYIAVANAMIGAWGNVRAAADSSLFHLRDFSGEASKGPDAEDLIKRSVEDEDYLDNGYVAVESTFALGYLLAGIANQQLGRGDEAADNFHRAAEVDDRLADLVERFRGSDYDTILMVEFGRGPMKVGVGPDQAIAQFLPQSLSDNQPLDVVLNGSSFEFPIACDLNAMARDHRWNNLEDVRKAKSFIGNLLVFGGAAAAIYGIDAENDDMVLAGAGMAVAGAFARAGAHADTRHCEALPQRIYLVPLNLRQASAPLELSVRGQPMSRMVLAGLSAPPPGEVQVRLVRLVSTGFAPPPWATSGIIVHQNDAMPFQAEAPDARSAQPYILGGLSVRSPSYESLHAAQEHGRLLAVSLTGFVDLYRAESIRIIRDDDPAAFPGLHVLEGGDSLFTPLPGSAGYLRLFAQEHPPYQPRSDLVRRLAADQRTPSGAALNTAPPVP